MKIIFVCTGNTCRSPIAEGYLKTFRISGLEVLSRGIHADGRPANEKAVEAAAQLGFDISSHISKNIGAEDLNTDRFICMDLFLKNILETLCVPKEKISVLAGGIPDPYGGSESLYRNTADSICSAIDDMVFGGEFTDFKVTPIKKEYVSEIARLERECFSTPWSEQGIIDSMWEGHNFFTAVDNEGKLLGYAGIRCILDEGYISNIAVFEAARGRGVGSMLICALLSKARRDALSFITLEVRPTNEKAIRLYERFGFKQEGRRKNFYTNPQEDAIIMTRRFK